MMATSSSAENEPIYRGRSCAVRTDVEDASNCMAYACVDSGMIVTETGGGDSEGVDIFFEKIRMKMNRRMKSEMKRLEEHHTYADDKRKLGQGIFGKPSCSRKKIKAKPISRILRQLAEHYTIDDTSKLGRGVFSNPISNRRHRSMKCLNAHQSKIRLGKRFQASIPNLTYDSKDREDEICV